MKNNIRIETEQALHMIESLTILAQLVCESTHEDMSAIYADVFELIRELNTAVEENAKEGEAA